MDFTGGDRTRYNEVSQVIEKSWSQATSQQLAALNPSGERYAPDREYPQIYDADFRRINDARRLAGFDAKRYDDVLE